MDLDQLHPELRASYRKFPNIPFYKPVVYKLLSLAMSLAPNRPKSTPGVQVDDHALQTCTVRVYRPERDAARGALMWLHGGGFVIGNTGMNDKECSAIVRELGLIVVSVNYRLAPKNPFPAAHEDCLAAWKFMLAQAGGWKIDSSRMAILGQSAGGALAASLVQRLVDEGGIQPAAQILWYPMLDDRPAADSELDAINHRFFSNRHNRSSWTWYLGQAPGLPSAVAYAVPARRESFKNFPATWICAGEIDLLFDEDRRYSEQLRTAGVECHFHVMPQTPHAVDVVAAESEISRNAFKDCYRFLSEKLQLNS